MTQGFAAKLVLKAAALTLTVGALDFAAAQPAAPQSLETQVIGLKNRLAKVHGIITAGGLWPITKGHVSCRVPGLSALPAAVPGNKKNITRSPKHLNRGVPICVKTCSDLER